MRMNLRQFKRAKKKKAKENRKMLLVRSAGIRLSKLEVSIGEKFLPPTHTTPAIQKGKKNRKSSRRKKKRGTGNN